MLVRTPAENMTICFSIYTDKLKKSLDLNQNKTMNLFHIFEK